MDDATKMLPTSYHQGYCYFDINTGKFWIDTTDTADGRKAINGTFYGICETSAGIGAKTVTIPGFSLETGVTIHVKFIEKNSATNPTLNVNGTGAKAMMQYGAAAMSTAEATNGWYAGAVVAFTYDGTYWVRDQGFNTNSTYYYTAVYSATAANTAAKVGTGNYFDINGSKYIPVVILNSNTAVGALSLNINSTGPKSIYINGEPSSATNYTLPTGYYLVWYDDENEVYHFRTDSHMPGDVAASSTATTTTFKYWDAVITQ